MARIGSSTPRRRIVPGIVVAAVIGAGAIVTQLPDPPPEAPVAAQGAAVDSGGFRDGFEGAGGGGAPVPPIVIPGACPEPPVGWTRVQKSWGELFGPNGAPKPQFPKSQSWPSPVPLVNRDQYTSTPFSMGPNQYVNGYFDQAQSRAPWYTKPRPADGMMLALSPCATGDFRVPNQADADRFVHPGCRMYENSGSLVFGTLPGVGCLLEPSKTYYLHIISANPEGGIQPGESSCQNNVLGGCDVGMVTGSN